MWYVRITCLSNHDYRKNGKVQKRGRVNLIGRLQLASEKAAEENHQEIAVLRELRTEVCVLASSPFYVNIR